MPFSRRYSDLFTIFPFRVQHRRDPEWDLFEYRVMAMGKDFSEIIPGSGWRAFEGGSYCSPGAFIPPAGLFVDTDELLEASERRAWRKVYGVLSSLPRIAFRESGASGALVKAGFHDLYFREMAKTHFRGKWNPEGKCWKLSFPGKEYAPAMMAALSAFASQRQRFSPGYPEKMPDLPMELLKHQTYVHRLIRDAGGAGRRAFLVAHDMGLGKTYTSLSAARSFIDFSGGAGAVAVVPPGIMDQWRRSALETGLSCEIYHSQNSKWESLSNSELRDADLIITGAEFLKGSAERLLTIAQATAGRLLILDEATKFKSRDSANYKAMLPLSLASEFVLFLSGSPILNNIGEMENLILLGDPGYYPLKEFSEAHAREKETEIYVPSLGRRITIKKTDYVNEKEFRRRCLPFFDREMKNSPSIGIILPDVLETNIVVEAGETERAVCKVLRDVWGEMYSESLDDEALLTELASGRRTGSAVVLIYEQMAINAPETLYRSKSRETSDFLKRVLAEIEERGIVAPGYRGAKMEKLIELLGESASRETPAVVFTGFKTTAEAIAGALKDSFPGRPIFTVVGATGHGRKVKVLDELKGGRDGIIVCTDAMAYGVEMQFANTLVQYDLPWSPMLADQRTGRINRIDASGERRIFYLTAADTIEDKKWRIHGKKRRTAETVLADAPREIQVQYAQQELDFGF